MRLSLCLIAFLVGCHGPQCVDLSVEFNSIGITKQMVFGGRSVTYQTPVETENAIVEYDHRHPGKIILNIGRKIPIRIISEPSKRAPSIGISQQSDYSLLLKLDRVFEENSWSVYIGKPGNELSKEPPALQIACMREQERLVCD